MRHRRVRNRKSRPSPPHWVLWNLDGCWFCKNRNNCNSCKVIKEYNHDILEKRKREEKKRWKKEYAEEIY